MVVDTDQHPRPWKVVDVKMQDVVAYFEGGDKGKYWSEWKIVDAKYNHDGWAKNEVVPQGIIDEPTARRIVAAVNACEGIPTEDLVFFGVVRPKLPKWGRICPICKRVASPAHISLCGIPNQQPTRS